MRKITLFFVILMLFSFSVAIAQNPVKISELPDYKQKPYRLEETSQRARSVFHPEFGQLHGELYTDVRMNLDGTADMDRKSVANMISILYNASGSLIYAEWIRFEWITDNGKPTNSGRLVTRGYSVTDSKLVFEKEREGSYP